MTCTLNRHLYFGSWFYINGVTSVRRLVPLGTDDRDPWSWFPPVPRTDTLRWSTRTLVVN